MYRTNPPSKKRLLEMYAPLIRAGGSHEVYSSRVKDFIQTYQREDRVIYIIYLHRYRETHRLLQEFGEAMPPKLHRRLMKIIHQTN